MRSAVRLKKFSLSSVGSVQALRPSLIELHGYRIALAGVASCEPLLRGCDQQAWLEQLVRLGIRHLVLPLNEPEEDTCLFARRHPASGGAGSRAIYDLSRRDEGVFARLQFLLDAAERIGVLIGLSLFDAGAAGPFVSEANEQGVSFAELWGRQAAARRSGKKNSTTIRRRAGLMQEQAEEALQAAVQWIAAEVRGRRAVWMEVFRGHHGEVRLSTAGDSSSFRLLPQGERETSSRLQQVGHRLTQRLAEALTRPGEDFEKAKLGPWVAAPPAFNWYGVSRAHRAPFAVWHGAAPDHTPVLMQAAEESRQPVLYWFTDDAQAGRRGRGPQRPALWRAVMRGCWPIVPWGLGGGQQQRSWKELAQLATFGRQWVGGGYLRPCGEMLAAMTLGGVPGGRACGATDGCGRYFAYFGTSMKRGVTLATLPGEYRYYWFNPASGVGLDSGDGIEGGRHCHVPAPGRAREALLILEQAELSDPMAAW